MLLIMFVTVLNDIKIIARVARYIFSIYKKLSYRKETCDCCIILNSGSYTKAT